MCVLFAVMDQPVLTYHPLCAFVTRFTLIRLLASRRRLALERSSLRHVENEMQVCTLLFQSLLKYRAVFCSLQTQLKCLQSLLQRLHAGRIGGRRVRGKRPRNRWKRRARRRKKRTRNQRRRTKSRSAKSAAMTAELLSQAAMQQGMDVTVSHCPPNALPPTTTPSLSVFAHVLAVCHSFVAGKIFSRMWEHAIFDPTFGFAGQGPSKVAIDALSRSHDS